MEAEASIVLPISKPPRVGRLLRRSEFLANKANGKSWTSKTMIVSLSPNDHAFPRIGLTVTKACGNAVERNRIRRRLRHLANALCAHLEGLDIVVIGKSACLEASWETLNNDLKWCLKRLSHPV